MKDVVVVGLGNLLMGDEGIGVRLVQTLSEMDDLRRVADFADLGTSWARLLHVIAGRRKAVLVDCARMGAAPGEIRRFTPADVRSRKVPGGASDHEADLLQTIELSRRLGECPDEVVIFGIEPARVEPRDELSPALEARLSDYMRTIAAELE